MPREDNNTGPGRSTLERVEGEVFLETLSPAKRNYIKRLVLRARGFSPEMRIGSKPMLRKPRGKTAAKRRDKRL